MSQDKNWVQQPKSEGGDYNPEWKPTEIGETIEGVLVKSEPNVGIYNKTIYSIKVNDDTTFSVWGTKVLDGQLDTVPINSYVKIEYLGKKKGKGNSYHDFNVFIAGEQAPAAATTPAPVAAETPAAAEGTGGATPAPAVNAPQPAAPTQEQQDDLPF